MNIKAAPLQYWALSISLRLTSFHTGFSSLVIALVFFFSPERVKVSYKGFS